jgi:hypothetical protein
MHFKKQLVHNSTGDSLNRGVIMAIPNKNSRKIVVGNETYKWIISPKDKYIILVAEHKEFKGRRIEVYIRSDIKNYHINNPNIEDLNIKIIKPKDVELIIIQAIEQGWNAEEKGPPIIFDLVGDLLVKRKS